MTPMPLGLGFHEDMGYPGHQKTDQLDVFQKKTGLVSLKFLFYIYQILSYQKERFTVIQCTFYNQSTFLSKTGFCMTNDPSRRLGRQALLQGIDAAVDDVLGVAHVPRVGVGQRPIQAGPIGALHARQHVPLFVLESSGFMSVLFEHHIKSVIT